MSSAEVDEFIQSNELDDGAASALRGCSADVLRAVLERGDLRGARNPSSAVMMRIKDAKAGSTSSGGIPPLGSSSGGMVSGPDADVRVAVDEFLRANDVDERAAESLRVCPSNVQKVVLGRGDLNGARNPSSALLTRIRDAKATAGEEAQASAASTLSAASMYGQAAVSASGSMQPGCGGLYGGAAALYGAPGGIYAGQGYGGSACGGAMPSFSAGIEQTTYVKMRGLPFSAIKEDILHFFSGYNCSSQDVTIGINSEGRPSGEAFVRFPSEQVAKEAIRERNKERMDHRYIELFPMTPMEAQRANLPGADAGGGAYGAYGQGGFQMRGYPGAYPSMMNMGAYGGYGGYAAAMGGVQPCAYGLYGGAAPGAPGAAGAYGAGAAGYGPAAGQGSGDARAAPY